MKYVGILLVLLWGSGVSAAWLRYEPVSGIVTCISSVQHQPCPDVPAQLVEDIPLSLLTGLNQPGTCALPVETLAPFVRVTNTVPLTLTFISPIVCFQGQLATTVEALHALRADFDRAIVGARVSPVLAAVYAIRCTVTPPPVGCPELRARLVQDIPTVQDINDAYSEFDVALGILTGP